MVSFGRIEIPPIARFYLYVMSPPYKGVFGVVTGMTFARAAIFWGSDRGKELLQTQWGVQNETVATLMPPLFVSTAVQIINQPLIRASITLQNPKFECSNTIEALQYLYKNYGLRGCWHGTSAGILKTCPKYCTAICVKDYMEDLLPVVDPSSPTAESDFLWRSTVKSATAGKLKNV